MTETMRALRLTGPDRVELLETDRPVPGAGEVLLLVAAAGVCHSDLLLRTVPPSLRMPIPVTLGHEVAGWVAELGPGVTGLEIGQLVAVYPLIGCGSCVACQRGEDNLCRVGFTSVGVHRDGGLADYMVVPARNAIDATGVDPTAAGPLTDAGLTAYHAVAAGLAKQPDARIVLVLGIGGLGHLALQALDARTPAIVIAVDTDPDKLDLAQRLGADHGVLAGPDATEAVLAIAGGRQVDLALDFVGVQSTMDLAAAATASGGSIVAVGLGGGSLELSATLTGPIASGASVQRVSVGSRAELGEVLDLARDSRLAAHTVTAGLEDALSVLDRLDRGLVTGRAVVVPNETAPA
jgi:propanol-preferring alcohol dehydrogenase